MITQELNDTLTQVGPGTPMGNLLRRYWHPVGTVAELEREPVQPVRLLGENLTLFRVRNAEFGMGNSDDTAEADSALRTPHSAIRYGLLAERCAHRGLSLAYGIPQPNGLRCAYHGWTYDTAGRCVDMPFEPTCLPLKIKAYPVQELGGLMWAYLGPDPAPLLPRHELFAREDMNKSIEVTPLPCSWLNCMDNSLDPIHYEHLHGAYGNYVARKLGRREPMHPARHLKIEFDLFAYGVYKRRLVEGAPLDADDWTRGHPILFPNTLLVGDSDRVRYQIRVPIDDTHTLHYNYNAWPTQDGGPRQGDILVTHTTIFELDSSIIADNVFKQDALAWVAQGPISDRTQEHLVTSDKGVILYHHLLLENIQKVERGEDPLGVIRDPSKNEPMVRISWEDRAKEIFWPGGRPSAWLTSAPEARTGAGSF